MQAYVIDAEPVHENSINYFAATLGFYRIGYYVDRYKLSGLPGLNLSEDTPVFGGFESIMSVFPGYVTNNGISAFKERPNIHGREFTKQASRMATTLPWVRAGYEYGWNNTVR